VKSHHYEPCNDHYDEKVEDLKRKYVVMARQIAGEDVKTIARELLDDDNLPFSEQVMHSLCQISSRCPMPRSMMAAETQLSIWRPFMNISSCMAL
jgi:hypothetical protein